MTYSLYMQAEFTALKLNAISVDLVKKKKNPKQYSELSHPVEIQLNKKSCANEPPKNITGHMSQAYQSIHLSKLFHGTPQAESQLSIKQNRFFRFTKQLLVQSTM